VSRGVFHIEDYRTTSKHAGGPRNAEQAVAVLPWAIDDVLGSRTRQERVRLLRRFLEDDLLIATKGLQARVRAQGRDRYGGEPKVLCYLFALPDVAYVRHRAQRYRRGR
jgi:hypothetical protein